MTQKLMTPEQVADLLGIDPKTLNNWRATKRYSLPYVKVGRYVRYKPEDVDTFIQSRTRTA